MVLVGFGQHHPQVIPRFVNSIQLLTWNLQLESVRCILQICVGLMKLLVEGREGLTQHL